MLNEQTLDTNTVGADTKDTASGSAGENVRTLLKRAFMFLEDGNWDEVGPCCEKVLDIDPENAEAYLVKLLAKSHLNSIEDIAKMEEYALDEFKSSGGYKTFLRFANDEQKTHIEALIDQATVHIDNLMLDAIKVAIEYGTVSTSLLQRRLSLGYARAARIIEKMERKGYIGQFDSTTKKRAILLTREQLREIAPEEYERMVKETAELAERPEVLKPIRDRIAPVRSVLSTREDHTVGLRSDGTVVAVGDNYASDKCNVSEWRNIIAISASDYHTVGLCSDGTVVAAGKTDAIRDHKYGPCKILEWRNIVAISAGNSHTVGLRSDGTVVATGENEHSECDVSEWRDIVAISAGHIYTVGLRSDGTVVATGNNAYGRCDVSEWRDIVAISAGDSHTVGLRSDGTVVAAGKDWFGSCGVSEWRDIVAVSAADSHTVGLRYDGTVVATGNNAYGRCDVSEWRDIVAVSAGHFHIVGLRSNGTVVATGDNKYGRCNVSEWKLFNSIDKYSEERKAAIVKLAERERRAHGVCPYCGGQFKGLFTKKCSTCSRAKDY